MPVVAVRAHGPGGEGRVLAGRVALAPPAHVVRQLARERARSEQQHGGGERGRGRRRWRRSAAAPRAASRRRRTVDVQRAPRHARPGVHLIDKDATRTRTRTQTTEKSISLSFVRLSIDTRCTPWRDRQPPGGRRCSYVLGVGHLTPTMRRFAGVATLAHLAAERANTQRRESALLRKLNRVGRTRPVKPRNERFRAQDRHFGKWNGILEPTGHSASRRKKHEKQARRERPSRTPVRSIPREIDGSLGCSA